MYMKQFTPQQWLMAAVAVACLSMGACFCYGQEITVVAPPFNYDEPVLAYTIARLQAGGITPTPLPTPSGKVKIGDICPTCNGKGQVDYDHDGKYDAACTDCGGDGKVDSGDPILSSPQESVKQHSIVEYASKDQLDDLDARLDIGLMSIRGQILHLQQAIESLQKTSPTPQEQPKEDQLSPTKKYRIKYHEEYYDWDEMKRSFIGPADKPAIHFTGVGDIAGNDYIKVCLPIDPNHPHCESCKLETYDASSNVSSDGVTAPR